MTCLYVRYNNLKKTGQLLKFWVEFGFGTVCEESAYKPFWLFFLQNCQAGFKCHKKQPKWLMYASKPESNVMESDKYRSGEHWLSRRDWFQLHVGNVLLQICTFFKHISLVWKVLDSPPTFLTGTLQRWEKSLSTSCTILSCNFIITISTILSCCNFIINIQNYLCVQNLSHKLWMGNLRRKV